MKKKYRKCNILSCWTLPIPDKKEKISVKSSQFNKNQLTNLINNTT